MKFIIFILLLTSELLPNNSAINLVRLKYDGGGDWYNDQSSDINLMKFIKDNTNINVKIKYEYVDLNNNDIFKNPLIWMTGHGNIKLSQSQAIKLRNYLIGGGFLFIDDDYGLDKYARESMKMVFPDSKFVEIPTNHPIYSSHFDMSKGIPKIHEHDDKSPKLYGIFYEGRLVVLYAYESNLGDGWADKDIHNDPEEKRIEALKMGTNIIVWSLTN